MKFLKGKLIRPIVILLEQQTLIISNRPIAHVHAGFFNQLRTFSDVLV